MTVFKVAKPGGNAETDASKDLAFDAIQHPCFNIIKEFTATLTTNGSGDGSTTVNHNLNYYPFFKAWVKVGSAYMLLHASGTYSLSYATSTAIKIQINGGDANKTYNYIIKVFGNEAQNTIGTGNNNVSGLVRVARPGQDAETATDIRQLAFQSGKYTLKLDTGKSGTTSITAPAWDIKFVDVYHNLGYYPFVFVKDTSDTESSTAKMLPVYYSGSGSYYEIYTNKIRIYVDNAANSYSVTYNYKYFVYRDKLA